MINLSVNINKVATLRNSRGGVVPSVAEAAEACLAAGAQGITVHPRSDERHIRMTDVAEIAVVFEASARNGERQAEFNIEGDPRSDLMDLVLQVRPHQCTLVPVRPGEITSQAGWPPDTEVRELKELVSRLRGEGIRVSMFIDPVPAAVRWVSKIGADRVELYTEPFAKAFHCGDRIAAESMARYVETAHLAHELGLGINAGHDLDLDNLMMFRALPHLDEVSIGHALISYALWVGLDRSIREYLHVLAPPA